MCYTQFSGRNFLFDPIGLETIIDSLHIDFHWDYNSKSVENFPLQFIRIQEDTAGSIHYFIRVCVFQSFLEPKKKLISELFENEKVIAQMIHALHTDSKGVSKLFDILGCPK